jgi:hypothetical protein
MKKQLYPLFIILFLLTSNSLLYAQNWGFEGIAASPPTTWTAVSGTWFTNTDLNYVRTGTQSMGITGPATSGSTMGNTSASVNVPTAGTYYVITIAWAKATAASNGVANIGYRISTTNTLNPSSTAAGQTPNMNNSTWSRVVSVSTATVAVGNYSPAIRAFQSASATPATTVYTDDYWVYTSTSNVADITPPNPVTSLTVTPGSPYSIGWVNGNDAATNISGKAGVVIVRATGSVGIPPVLNSQAMYSPGGGVAGTSSFVQNGITWNVVANITDSIITSYNDATATFPGQNYTYAVIMRDKACNYSNAVIAPPSAGLNMAYFSSTTTQVTGNVGAGAKGKAVIRIEIETEGDQSPLQLSSFNLSTNGTTNTSEIANAKIYSTGYSPIFDTSVLFGSTATPNGVFTVNGSKALSIGTNYFWLAYDVASPVVNCNTADAECNSITINSIPQPPMLSAPLGGLTLRTKLNGIYTINPGTITDCFNNNFQTFSEAVNYLNTFGADGNVIFNVPAGSVFKESPLVITASSTNTNTITFQKDGVGVNPIIYGINGTGTLDAVVALSGVNYIIFDGIDVADSVSNAIAATQMEYGYGIVNSSATVGSNHNTIKNCKVTLRRSNTATIGIAQSTLVAATQLSGGNHNNRYENVKIENSYNGIALLGTDAFPDSNNVITSSGGDTTIIGANTVNDIGAGTAIVCGINVAQQKNVEVSKCIVRNLQHTASLISSGIWLNNTLATSDYGTAKIFNNQIFNIRRTTITTGVAAAAIIGIRVEIALLSSARVYSNIIHSMSSTNTTASVATGQTIRGISYGHATGTGTAEFYHNSVYITNTNPTATTVAFWKGGAATIIARNNIFSDSSVANTGTARHYAVYLLSSSGPITSSNNILWSTPTTNGFLGFGGIGVTAADRATLPLWNAATASAAPSDGTELGSAHVDPNFASPVDLTFLGATAAAESGAPIVSFPINTDILGNAKSATSPSIGAYETFQPQFDSAAPIISNIIINSGSSPSIYASVKDNSNASLAGSIQLWYRLGTSGPFTALAPDSIPLGNMNGTYKWSGSFISLSAGNYQFYIAVRDGIAPGSNISFNPVQALTFSGFNLSDPVNYAANPDPGVNTRTFRKLISIAGGTYNIGPTGDYAKLTNAANALSNSELTGNIILQFQPSYDGTTGESFPITFNPFVSTGGNWLVKIRPASGASNIQIKGTNATLIDLNGVKGLTLDGRAGGIGSTKDLTITNTSTSGIAIRFINDAQNDTLSYLSIVDSNNSITSGGIVFSTSNVVTSPNGNSNNLIDHCNINGSGASANCIYSVGSAAPADNKNNTITNCNIFDFFSNSVAAVNGILLGAGNSSWNIGTTGNGNNFYQTATRNSTSVPALTTAVGFRAIQINDASVGGCNIVGNRIGGNIPGIPSSVFNIGDNVGTAYLGSYIRAIDIITANAASAISIQDNTISDITLYTSITAGFSGISALGGLVNSGNITGNTIGATTGTGSINLFYKNTTGGVNFYGIRYGGAIGGLVQNNSIGSITADAAAGSLQLIPIYSNTTFTSPFTVSNNLVGSLTTPHSIQSTAGSIAPVNVMGIVMSSAQGVAVSITNNTLMNLSSFCTNVATTNGLKGIYITGASTISTAVSGNIIRKLYSESGNPAVDQSSAIVGINCTTSGAGLQIISNNTISALMSGAISGAINVVGIYYASTTTATTNRIERNLIHSLSASPSNGSAALVSGITQGAGAQKLIITNNMVRLGLDSTGTSATGPHFITGIQKTTGSENVTVFNSVVIEGAGVANGTSNSYAYRSNAAGNDSLMNNIFVNNRSNASTGGNHYAIGLSAAATLKVNYNLYNATAILGQFANVDRTALSDWQAATSQDVNSVNTAVNFVSTTDLHLTGASLGNLALKGIQLSGFPTDFDNQTRTSFPYMGADETTPALPVELTNFAAKQIKDDALLYWVTASENNASHFNVERSVDGKRFESVARIKAIGNSTKVNNYNFTDLNVMNARNIVYYRLKMVDNNGSYEYSKTVLINKNKSGNNLDLTILPNPFNSDVQIVFNSEVATPAVIVIKDITGKQIYSFVHQATIGTNAIPAINLESLRAGLYFISIEINGQTQTSKIIKQ